MTAGDMQLALQTCLPAGKIIRDSPTGGFTIFDLRFAI